MSGSGIMFAHSLFSPSFYSTESTSRSRRRLPLWVSSRSRPRRHDRNDSPPSSTSRVGRGQTGGRTKGVDLFCRSRTSRWFSVLIVWAPLSGFCTFFDVSYMLQHITLITTLLGRRRVCTGFKWVLFWSFLDDEDVVQGCMSILVWTCETRSI